MMNRLDNAFAVLKNELPRLHEMGISNVGVFGSIVRGEDRPNSDLDILIDLEPDHSVSMFTLIGLEQYLAVKMHEKVDLVIKQDLKPGIRDRILGEVVYVGA